MVRDGKPRCARKVDQFTELFGRERRFEGAAPSDDGNVVDWGACEDVEDGGGDVVFGKRETGERRIRAMSSETFPLPMTDTW